MPYGIRTQGTQHCVVKLDGEEVSEWLECYDKHDDALAYQRALTVNVTAREEARKSAVDELSKAMRSSYDLGPNNPIVWLGVSHNAWEDKLRDFIPTELIARDLDYQAKSIVAGDKRGDWPVSVWHNGYRYVVPESYFNGKAFTHFGALLKMHNPFQKVGVTAMSWVADGLFSCVNVGTCEQVLKPGTMSIGFRYLLLEDIDDPDHQIALAAQLGYEKRTQARKGEYPRNYVAIHRYECSRIDPPAEANARTFWSSHRSKLTSDAFTQLMAEQLIAAVDGLVDEM